ncbi:MAG: Clp protease N-terminal domain-containing protein [Lachnospiraceae bacterium]
MDFFARFTNKAKEALSLAAECAKELGHNYVGTEHLLAGLCGAEDSTSQLLSDCQVNVENVASAIVDMVGKGDYIINNSFGYTEGEKDIRRSAAIFVSLATTM